ncbi:MAG: serine hydrolase domain-containing protein [Reyranellales bacterium]
MDIAQTLKDAVAAGDVPGVAAAAATDDGVIFEGAAGTLAPDSVVWIASMTKAITGAAAMQLVERGKLELDAPASAVVPEIGTKGVLEGFDAAGKARTRPPRQPVTLRHLLTHTSGLGYDTWNADVMRYREATGIPAVGSCQNAALTTPLLAEPGERWEYGISIDWAGKMVEAASGMRLDRYLKENILDPLGMTDTGFKIGSAQRPRKARMHTRGASGLVAIDHELPQAPEFHMGGGGLYSTVGDYLKFTRMILGGGGSVLKRETVALMSLNAMGKVSCRRLKSQTPASSHDLDFVDGMKWGLSFMINPAAFPGRRSAGSLAWGGLANSYYWVDPVRKVTGVWATQLLPFYDPRAVAAFENFERSVYAAL